MESIRRIPIFLFALALLSSLAPQAALAAPKKVDINTASQQELEALPGVGEATAKKIIAGRPYSSIGDLARAGVPESTIQKISGQVKAGRSAETKAAKEPKEKAGEKAAPATSARSSSASSASIASSAPPAVAVSPAPGAAAPPARSAAPASGQVDLNTASQKDLEALPGVGVVTAKKIIAGRPYASVNDLARAGVSHSTMAKISSRITVGAGAPASTASSASKSSAAAPPAASARPAPAGSIAPASPASSAAPAPAAASSASPAPAARSGSSPAGSEVAYQPPPAAGMVWVNLDTKVFHRQGDRWYGKTKHGRYMTESDAVADGNRESKTH